jgi:penicillin-binding protein 2
MAVPGDRRKIAVRLTVVQYGLTVIFAFLALAFWYLQVVQYGRFYELAENNHQRTLPLRAPRGVLFDRNGRVLVENRDSYNISIVREHSKNLPQTIRLLASVTGVEEARLQDTIRRREAEPKYRPIPVIEDASLAQVAAVAAHRLDFPDVIFERVPTRQYPIDDLAAHLFGYVGEVTEEQLAGQRLRAGDIVGQSGVEKVYNTLLMGQDGKRLVVVNSAGREVKTLEEIQPTEGRRVELTIDFDVQRATEEAFRTLGYNGAAVILDPRNGEVLSYVSLPAYDPNAFAARGPDFGTTWADLNTDTLKPLQNRAIQGRYSPGSTFKIAVATAALQEGVIDPATYRVHCVGSASFFGRSFKCWKKGGHGTMDLEHAIEQSCNVFFYTLGNLVGIDRIHKWATLLGLGEKSGIDLPNEVQGLVPSSEWKRATTGVKWYAGETISVAIGQGQVSVTPVSMAVYASTVANGGTRYVPHLVRAVDEGHGWKPVPAPPPKSQVDLKPETIQALHQGLWMVVNAGGTGGNARIPGKDVAGKTGTAQVISLEGAKALAGRTDLDLRDNGWFVFFAPRDNPEIAGVVFAEHAVHGTEAAKIAHYAMETYFAKKDGKPLPQFPAPKGPPTLPAGEPRIVIAATPGVPR